MPAQVAKRQLDTYGSPAADPQIDSYGPPSAPICQLQVSIFPYSKLFTTLSLTPSVTIIPQHMVVTKVIIRHNTDRLVNVFVAARVPGIS